jgi:hypothetical protein
MMTQTIKRMHSSVVLLLVLIASISISDVASFTVPLKSHSIGQPLAHRSLSGARISNLFASADDNPSTIKSGRTWRKRDSLAIHKLPRAAYRVYVAYVRRLWKETDPEARNEVVNDKVKGAIRNMQYVLSCDEYKALSDEGIKSQEELLEACENMLATLSQDKKQPVASQVVTPPETGTPAAKSKPRRSITLGVLMGIAVACWVFSGNYIFTALFTLVTILGQLEYYRMIMKTGVYPARRISVIGAASMFLTVSLHYCKVRKDTCIPFSRILFICNAHTICFPLGIVCT